ncbi:uncharacterized protein BDV17DRAFT_256359 [Aspergillus undulatus]|uniref:uncharacterized protein n=1 Tax=Aspergillus undulatus TaxID=1810928 RepID=UPI003CCE2A89
MLRRQASSDHASRLSIALSNELQTNPDTLSSDAVDYTWSIIIFFHGRATIGSTKKIMIPISMTDPFAVRVVQDNEDMTT